MRLNRIQQRASVRTSSGDVTASRLQSASDITTSSGDVKLRDSRGGTIQTSSGDVEATAVSGSLSVHSSSGEIQLRPIPSRGDAVEAQSSSGDVSVWLPRGAGVDVDVHTNSGDIIGRVPIKVRSATRTGLLGRIGAGGAGLHVTTTSGNVTLLAAGAAADDE